MNEIPVTDILQKVAEDVCNDLCKYLDEANKHGMSQQELDSHCEECPLRRLV